MLLTFTFLSGEKLEVPVEENSCIIGRSSKCQVVITKEGISRQHCLIEVSGSEVYVTDLDSTNGVMIDGVKIPPSTRTLLHTYLPLSFGPVATLQIQRDLTQSFIISNSQTKFFKIPNKGPENPIKTPQGHIRLSKPKVNPVRLQTKKSFDLKDFINTLIVILLAVFVYWFVKIRKNEPPEDLAPKSRSKDFNSDYF